MSKVLSMRLRDEQMQRLQRVARRMNRTPSETAALLLDESLREAEFAYIQFRDSPAGRQPYVQGTRMAAWHVVAIARGYGGDVTKTAEHLVWLPAQVQAALNYAEAFPEEIDAAIEDNNKGYEELKRLIPDLRLHEVPAEDSAGAPAEDERQRAAS
jgi:uncharacterized protein (DUF433 family)